MQYQQAQMLLDGERTLYSADIGCVLWDALERQHNIVQELGKERDRWANALEETERQIIDLIKRGDEPLDNLARRRFA